MDRLGAPVTQLLGAAVGVVLGAVVLFAVIGAVRDDGTSVPEVADGTDVAAAPEDDASEAAPAEDEAPAEAPEDDAATGDGTEESPADDAAEGTEDEPAEEPADEPEPEQTVPAAVEPGSVSIQVLDATGSGSSSAARRMADELREAGYDVIVINPAGRTYDETTVFWSEGQAAGGQQIAAEFSITRSSATPEEVRLSDSVDVHVVVGTDRT